MPRAPQPPVADKHLRWDKFALGYATHHNAKRAYEEAGFLARGHAAEVQASKLLKRPEVQALIAQYQREVMERCRLTREDYLDRLEAVVTFDPMSLLDEQGRPVSLRSLPKATRAALDIEITRSTKDTTIKIRPRDKHEAMTALAKAQKWTEEAPPRAANWTLDPVTLSKLPDEDLERAIEIAKKLNGQ